MTKPLELLKDIMKSINSHKFPLKKYVIVTIGSNSPFKEEKRKNIALIYHIHVNLLLCDFLLIIQSA
jgi:hypothetical protein